MGADTLRLILNIYIVFLVISFSFSVLIMIVGTPLFKKANKKTYEALIPIYNLYVLLKITKVPVFNFLVFLFPLFNIILIIYIEYKLHKLFYTSKLFYAGLILFPFVFIPLLSYGKYKYKHKPSTRSEEEDKEIDTSPLLMSEEEIQKENEEKAEDNLDVDSIFKSDIELIEEVAPYKASKANSEDDIYRDEDLHKNEERKTRKFEEVDVVDLSEIKGKEDDEKIEIVDL